MGDAVRISSAGFIGPGRPSPEIARAAARESGIDLSRHRSRLLDAETVGEDDLVIVMSGDQVARARAVLSRPRQRVLMLGDLDPLPIARRTIQDPYGRTADVFERVFGRIERCTMELARALGGA